MRHFNAPPMPSKCNDDYRMAVDAVAEGRASWEWDRPIPVRPAPEVHLVDDDGTPLETPAEMARRHRDEHAALVAVAELRADFLVDRPSDEDMDEACETVIVLAAP